MEEIWKDVVGYEGVYSISSIGRLKRLEHVTGCSNGQKRMYSKGIVHPSKTGQGYLKVSLNDGKKITQKLVHRLVAESFIDNPKNKRTVNHKDGDTMNNELSNLEWATDSENNKHSYNELGRSGAWKSKFGFNHNRSKPVVQICPTSGNISVFGSIREANRETGLNADKISEVCREKRNSTGGFKWMFKKDYDKKHKTNEREM